MCRTRGHAAAAAREGMPQQPWVAQEGMPERQRRRQRSRRRCAAPRRCCCRCCCLQRLPHPQCTRGHNSAFGAAVTARVTHHVLLMPHCEERQSVTPSFPSGALPMSSGASVHPSARNSACVRAVSYQGLAHTTPPFRSRLHVQPVTGGRSLLAAVTVIWDGLLLRLVRAVFARAHSRMAATSGGGDGF